MMLRLARTSLLVGLVALGGCANDAGVLTWEPETEQERALRESRERLERTQGEGSLAGAGLGALIGAVTGGASGAVQGAQIGRLGGAAAGAYVRQIQTEFATREAVLDRVASDIAAANAELETSIAALRALVETRRSQIGGLRQAGDGPQLTRQIARTGRNLEEANRTVETAAQTAEFFGAARNLLVTDGIAPAGALSPELAALQARVATLRSIAQELATDL